MLLDEAFGLLTYPRCLLSKLGKLIKVDPGNPSHDALLAKGRVGRVDLGQWNDIEFWKCQDHRGGSGDRAIHSIAPRKASRRKTRRTPPVTSRVSRDGVPAMECAGKTALAFFRRDVDEGEHAEMVIAE